MGIVSNITYSVHSRVIIYIDICWPILIGYSIASRFAHPSCHCEFLCEAYGMFLAPCRRLFCRTFCVGNISRWKRFRSDPWSCWCCCISDFILSYFKNYEQIPFRYTFQYYICIYIYTFAHHAHIYIVFPDYKVCNQWLWIFPFSVPPRETLRRYIYFSWLGARRGCQVNITGWCISFFLVQMVNQQIRCINLDISWSKFMKISDYYSWI